MANKKKAKPANQEQKWPPIIAKTVDLFWNSVNIAQFNAFQEATKNGEFEPAFLALIEEIASRLEKNPNAPAEDPASPGFSIDALRQEIQANGGFKAVSECLDEYILAAMEQAGEIEISADQGKAFEELSTGIKGTAKAALSQITAFIQTDFYKELKETVDLVSAFMREHKDEIAALSDYIKDMGGLLPFIQMELDEAQNNPDFAGVSAKEILRHGIKANGEVIEGKYKPLIERAKKRRAEYEETEEALEEIERFISTPTDKITYPLDKPNRVIWNLLAAADPSGQLQMQIDTSKRGSGKKAVVYYGINFDALETSLKITRSLTPFDKRCYIAAAALYNSGNTVISATQLHKKMGNAGQPTAAQIKKINDSITKMGAAHIYIDNAAEVSAKMKYNHFSYDASLMPFERVKAYINNTLCEAAIHLFREPPLITFARERHQITTISQELLESPVSKTDANLILEDYLIERIGQMKSGTEKAQRKILYKTIYEHCEITTRLQRSRAPEKIRRYLDHYKKCGWIAEYTEETDGITILL